MPDDVVERHRRRFRIWPRTVRVRITTIATVAFAITVSAAAFGLVRFVHSELTDRIHETNQQQLTELTNAVRNAISDGSLTPQNPHTVCFNDPRTGQAVCRQRFDPQPGFDSAIREINTTAGNIQVVSQQSLATVDRTVHSVTDVLLFAVPALIAGVGLLTWYLTGRALRPVEAIRSEAEAITGTTMHRRVPEPDTDDEVGRLARTMNSMLERLEAASQRQRQFVSDASHELRTPVASIRANLEVALRQADETDWPKIAERVLAEDSRMEQTISQMLALARLDEVADDRPVSSLPEVDLDEIVHDQALGEHRVPIDVSRVLAGRVHGRREELTRVVRNLLENAARHADSWVEVDVHREGDDIVLLVDDDGPGIPVDDRERVFDRFTRLDDGRARDAGGLGLGLSLVRTTVEQHGGSARADAAPIGGARLEVRLPVA
jgi:signal transduction histidine kinase